MTRPLLSFISAIFGLFMLGFRAYLYVDAMGVSRGLGCWLLVTICAMLIAGISAVAVRAILESSALASMTTGLVVGLVASLAAMAWLVSPMWAVTLAFIDGIYVIFKFLQGADARPSTKPLF
jgi:hypothetical protein